MNFEKWFRTFLAEKELSVIDWEIVNDNGTKHFISSSVVVEHILVASPDEQAKIKDIIVQIDFRNGDVNHFFKHLAGALVNQYDGY